MTKLSRTLVICLCAAAAAAAVANAQPGAGPWTDGGSEASAPPGSPQSGPDGAPDPRSARGPAQADGRGWTGTPPSVAAGRSSWGPWGRSGPSPDLTAKMTKAQELDGKVWPLIQKVRAAKSNKDQSSAKAELRKAIAALFDAKLAVAEEAQKSHEEIARDMKARIERRKARRDELIDRKVEEAIGESDDDDW